MSPGWGAGARRLLAVPLAALGACGPEGGAAPDSGAPAPAASAEDEGEVRALREELASARADLERTRRELGEVRGELAREREARAEREAEWLRFNQSLAGLDVEELIAGLSYDVHLPLQGEPAREEQGPPPAPEAAEEASYRRERAGEIATSLRNLMRLEEVHGLDLLEPGTLGDGYIGPVVFRLLDDRGRLVGSLFAERLRLESSRAAHTLTLVLEEGYESRGGERFPFTDGARRIVLPHVDPDPWVGAAPELFLLRDLSDSVDDGLWDVERVRRALNERLRADASGGFYLLHRVGGIRGETLREVQLSGFDESGRLERRLFADRLHVVPQPTGVQLVLEDGAVVRGDEKVPFLEGRFRIFLPRASVPAWRAARLPGLWSPLEVKEAPVTAPSQRQEAPVTAPSQRQEAPVTAPAAAEGGTG